MYLLYLDDAGSPPNSLEQYFVLGGIAVFEAQIEWFARRLDELAEKIYPVEPASVEFHASTIYSRRRPPWNQLSQQEARGFIKSVLQIAAESYVSARAFACAVDKRYCGPMGDPVQLAFEDLCSRFDMFLSRLRAQGEQHRGVLILDKSTYETPLQQLSRDFRRKGTRWGTQLKSVVDIPYFVDSGASRLIQCADCIAYAVFRRYNAGDAQYFDVIAHRFDVEGGVVHGLSHKTDPASQCMCPACLSRRAVRTSQGLLPSQD